MNLPTDLPADTCWLMMPFDDLPPQQLVPDALRWQIAPLAADRFDTMAPTWLSSPPAALRLLGEATQPPADSDWYAAIDPVTFAADMRDVRIQTWPQKSLEESEAELLAAAVERLLEDDSDPRLSRMSLIRTTPWHWYLTASAGDALEFSATPAMYLPGEPLRHHKQVGADGALVRRLSTEIQMQLHQHEINGRREQRGKPVVNGVWMWGAGGLPGAAALQLPALVSDDPVWRGCWRLQAPDSAVLGVSAWADAAAPGGRVLAPATRQQARAMFESALATPSIANVVIATPGGSRICSRRGRLSRLLQGLRGAPR